MTRGLTVPCRLIGWISLMPFYTASILLDTWTLFDSLLPPLIIYFKQSDPMLGSDCSRIYYLGCGIESLPQGSTECIMLLQRSYPPLNTPIHHKQVKIASRVSRINEEGIGQNIAINYKAIREHQQQSTSERVIVFIEDGDPVCTL